MPDAGNKVRYMADVLRRDKRLPKGPTPPDNDDMEARVAKLEDSAQDTRDRLARIETRLDTFATREDLHDELHKQTWRFIGAVTTLGIAVIGSMVWIAKNIQ